MSARASLAACVASLVLAACGPSPSSGTASGAQTDSGPSSGHGQDSATSADTHGGMSGESTDGNDGATDTDTGEPPLVCEEGWTVCNGECVTLNSNLAHCGECFHSCQGAGVAHDCVLGLCGPALWPCMVKDDPWEAGPPPTCADACAAAGETCVDDPQQADCAGNVAFWFDDGPTDTTIEDDIEICQKLHTIETLLQQSCSEPLPWDLELGGQKLVGLACCCTQD